MTVILLLLSAFLIRWAIQVVVHMHKIQTKKRSVYIILDLFCILLIFVALVIASVV